LHGVVAAAEESAARKSQSSAAGGARTGVDGTAAALTLTTEERARRVEASAPNQIRQSDMRKFWADPAVGWDYPVSTLDCWTRGIAGWNLSHRCRTEDALAPLEQAVLERLTASSRSANLTQTIAQVPHQDLSAFPTHTFKLIRSQHAGTSQGFEGHRARVTVRD